MLLLEFPSVAGVAQCCWCCWSKCLMLLEFPSVVRGSELLVLLGLLELMLGVAGVAQC